MAGAIDDEYTYDRALADGGPYVPDVDDLGGDEIEDDAGNAPQKGSEPYGGLYNERARNLAGLNRMTSWCRLWLEWDSGESEWNIVHIDAMGTLLTSDSFTLTPDATGVVTIEWAAGTLPPMARKPLVFLTDAFGCGWGAISDANAVTVRLHDEDKNLANLNFAVELR